MQDNFEFEEEEDSSLDEKGVERFSEAVLYSTDWTVETILSQLRRENIQLNPNFQRRDAWSNSRKSKFIESIIIGLPIPQLVLAEQKDARGKYIVLDGKQRLLSLLKFVGVDDDKGNGFALSGLEARPDLKRIRFQKMDTAPEFESDLNSFLNYSIRTVIIRNWPSLDFLHQVFLRLNTGSVKLSSQELRQAMAPGPFSEFVDSFAAESEKIQKLLGRDDADPRMRDVELLVRSLAFRNALSDYQGRMKQFLDSFCIKENKTWRQRESEIREQASEFEEIVRLLFSVFGEGRVARKESSNSFNRAIFDALSYFLTDPAVRAAVEKNKDNVRKSFEKTLRDQKFLDAVESDTAGIPNTLERLKIWGGELSQVIGIDLNIPSKKDDGSIVVQ